ncbi:hypothetical protein POSPLADRAFT_1127844 [Postia placenta MAD-698-R-SB12]|uniref:GRIP domain-containing protein n=1 Tax=Postia placenta MAD-698-R-SB12 TaxID=670580 RepID=A0A1X6NFL7_9APHY|nr:hypothetical protein POSPLADRAFT_1127844 [Postia placenta MAD-698-R-SB12]OSX67427.1 hypothetical protein POSPLADRAFT_1127844 [Postia placenta MAD-698-R-SB12]
MRSNDCQGSLLVRTRFTRSLPREVHLAWVGQEERIEELRDIHRLESKSQSDQIEKLRSQVDEAEALLKASLNTNSQLEQELTQQKTGIEKLQADVGRANGTAKDEEEKRVKAVTLLKTVRQKLVKAEKERDDALKEMRTMKDQEREEKEKEAAEKLNLQREIERLTADKETALNSLKSQFEKEMNALKDKQERELLAFRGQFEMEAMATKSSHARELESKSSRVSELQTTVRTLEGEKDEFFDQLQLRQAELESSRSRLETMESQTTEYQYQLHEAQERIALLSEELADARREHESRALSTGPSAQEVTRLLSAAEVKYESRISDLRKRLSAVERERDEGEAEWSHKLSEKMRDLESLKAVLNSSAKSREEESESANSLREEIDALKAELQAYQARILELKAQVDRAAEVENNAHTEVGELNARIVAIQQLVEDGKAREAQLRTHNKTLREELRKVQSSAALLERQRNPGVGYWASRQESSPEIRSPRSSVSDLTTRDTPSRPGSPAVAKSDEEINVEYLRNIILQFLEHKEMRPHLVRILSTILRFTPQETRRLVSKV